MERKTLLLTVVLVSVAGIVAGVNRQGEACNNPADMVFVLDESGSIWGPHFTKQLEFVCSIIDTFNVDFNQTNIGVETFSDGNRIIFNLGDFNDAQEMKAEVMRVGQRRGGTRTFDAIERMHDVMFSRRYVRSWVPHIAIVVTDGESENPAQTAREADRAKDDGITMFAVGVGHSITMEELYSIASDPDLVFTVDSYDILDQLKDMLAWKACQVTTLPPPTTTTTTTTTTTPPPPPMIEGCTGTDPMDIVFSIPDQAGIIGTEYSMAFIRSVVGEFIMGPEQTHVGLTPRFCDDAEGIHLREYDNKGGFNQALERRLLRGTHTNWQLEYLIDVAFSPENGGRQNSKKFGVMVIDNNSHDFEETQGLAEVAEQDGITLMVIGVGSHVDDAELEAIASSSDHWFRVDTYEELADLREVFLQQLCEGISGFNPNEILDRRNLRELFLRMRQQN